MSGMFVQHAGPSVGDDTARLNALLDALRTAGGGVLRGQDGVTYTTSAPLVVGSNTEFDFSKSKWVLAAGSNCHMIHNYSSVNHVATATDAATSAGSNVVTTSLGAQAVAGMTLTVAGAANNGNGPLIGNVVSATATTITLAKLHGDNANATTTVSGAAVTLSNRDANIKIRIGVADRGANGPNSGVAAGSAVAGHSVYLKHVDHFLVDVARATSTGGVSFVWPTDVTDGDIWFRSGEVVRTAVQVVGPVYNVRVHQVSGYTPDDLVNLCGNVYKEQTDTCGDVIDVTVGDLHSYGNTLGSVLKLNAGPANLIDRIVVTGRLSGRTTTGNAICWVGDDVGRPETTGGSYGTIDLGFFDAQTTGNAIKLDGANIDSLRVRGRSLTNAGFYTTGTGFTIGLLDVEFDFMGAAINSCCQIRGTGTIQTFILRPGRIGSSSTSLVVVDYGGSVTTDHLLIDSATLVPPSTAWKLLTLGSGTINRLTVRDVHAVYGSASNGLNLVQNDGGTLGIVKFLGGHVHQGDTLLRHNSGSLSEVHFAHVTTNAGQRLLNVQAAGTYDVYLDGVQRVSSAQQPFVAASGVTLNVRGGTFRETGSAGAFSTGAGTVNVLGGLVLKTGTATLVAGTVTVADTSITANSVIRLTSKTAGGTVGAPFVSARSAGASFTITSTNTADSSVIQYEILQY